MAQRLVEVYQAGQAVEVLLTQEEQVEWHIARVLGFQHPGVWVLTERDRQMWFVTNGKRIRPHSPEPSSPL